jgi:hypothetical protein
MLLQVRQHSFILTPHPMNSYSLITTHSEIIPPRSEHRFPGSVPTIQYP